MDSAAASTIGTTLEAILIAPILQPIAGDAGPFGAYGIDLIAQRIAQHDVHGFAALVADQLKGLP